ncbi:uncharacterized protein IUM83_10089 [Phytophthora cinnamomi]|uniref:uncharacterized protein n=1 Tax=Phytophthora cinnamomi TaxID=4785 RepID=UPI00355981DE|nr:hypothetical protein IUM83_10089 [Phytophthora cinnamomi]
MSLARSTLGLLLAALVMVGCSAVLPDCDATQLNTIKSIATATPLANYLGICKVLSSYEVYPFKTAPTGTEQDYICTHLFCRTGLKEFYKAPGLPQCYIKVDGESITPNAQLQRICPDLMTK